jgi:hypothetical protein
MHLHFSASVLSQHSTFFADILALPPPSPSGAAVDRDQPVFELPAASTNGLALVLSQLGGKTDTLIPGYSTEDIMVSSARNILEIIDAYGFDTFLGDFASPNDIYLSSSFTDFVMASVLILISSPKDTPSTRCLGTSPRSSLVDCSSYENSGQNTSSGSMRFSVAAMQYLTSYSAISTQHDPATSLMTSVERWINQGDASAS